MFLFVVQYAIAADKELNNPELLSVPTAAKLRIERIAFNPQENSGFIIYKFLTVDGVEIFAPNGRADRIFVFSDRPAQKVIDCLDVGHPYTGCTGAGTGENLDPGDKSYSDVYDFLLTAADNNKKMGNVLWRKIWEKMKPAILSPANDTK